MQIVVSRVSYSYCLGEANDATNALRDSPTSHAGNQSRRRMDWSALHHRNSQCDLQPVQYVDGSVRHVAVYLY